MDSDRPNKPIMITGLRPMWSERRLQWRTVMACVAKNIDCYGSLVHLFETDTATVVAHHDTNIIAHASFISVGDAYITD